MEKTKKAVKRNINTFITALLWCALLASMFYVSMAIIAIVIGCGWPTWFLVAVILSVAYLLFVAFVFIKSDIDKKRKQKMIRNRRQYQH